MRKNSQTRTGQVRVGIIADEMIGVVRDFLSGFYRAVRPEHDWALLQSRKGARNVEALLDWGPDYLISPSARYSKGAVTDRPVSLYYLSSHEVQTAPWFRINDWQAGEQAARHLLQSVYRNAACVYWPGHYGSCLRLEGFQSVMEEAGVPVFTFEEGPVPSTQWDVRRFTAEDPTMRKWLQSLPRSTGIYCWQDHVALWVSSTCFRLGLEVPNDFGIVGTDNRHELTLRSWPELDSVLMPFADLGKTAAAWIARHISEGEAPMPDPISPNGVCRRKSTSQQTLNVPELAAVAKVIKETELGVLSPAFLVNASGWSRSTLERRFLRHTGKTLHDVLEIRRLERAEYLLTHTVRTVADIADEVGYATPRSLELIFRKHYDTTPGAYARMRHLSER